MARSRRPKVWIGSAGGLDSGETFLRYEIRELGVGGILDQAIALVKDRLPLLLGIMLLVYVPVDLVQQWVASLSQQAGDQVTAKADFGAFFW